MCQLTDFLRFWSYHKYGKSHRVGTIEPKCSEGTICYMLSIYNEVLTASKNLAIQVLVQNITTHLSEIDFNVVCVCVCFFSSKKYV